MTRTEAATRTDGVTPERSIGELFGELATTTGTLVRQEVTLATTEMTQKATYAAKKSLLLVAGALFAGVSLLVLAAALVIVLARWVPLWGSALIVAALFGVLANVLVRSGISALKNMELRPTETLGSLKDNKIWATKQLQ